MVRPFAPARYRTESERRRIRLQPCFVCYTAGPSYVYDALAHGYPSDGWLGRLWPVCLHHRWEAQRLGWRGLLAQYQVEG